LSFLLGDEDASSYALCAYGRWRGESGFMR
jgi:hypothetical protein